MAKQTTKLYASDTVEAPLDYDDWPEQTQLDFQRRHVWSHKLELGVTNLVAKYPTFIWWLTIVTCCLPMAVFFAVEWVSLPP